MAIVQRSKVSELVKGTTTVVTVFVTTIAALVGVGSFVSLTMQTLL